LDCSPTNRECELGLDCHETDYVIVIVIELSMRGTIHSDIWYLHLSDQTMVQSYHLLDYG
ncbi:hypothetical protein AN958_09142, partial [Leucoagaricus sp. SymC.cos]